MKTKVHMCISIDGLMRKRDRELNGLFTDDNGFEINANGARKYLTECKAKGWRVLPMGKCDNFCYQEGCKGHPYEDEIQTVQKGTP